jgi:pimeloyl-ACP methyl ester carboxylesterase
VRYETITLTNGALRFSALAAGAGPIVLLLHGFPDTPRSFTHQLSALADAGYRAIAVTTRGYEPQSQPADSDYHAVRMAEDVVTWARNFGDGPVHLVGHDWGANIAFAAAALGPECFASLTALAVPHPVRFGEAYAARPDQQQRSAYVLEFLAPEFEQTVIANNCSYLEQLWRTWSPRWSIPIELVDAMRSAFRKPGVAKAALEYYRQAFDVVSPAGQQTATLFSSPIRVPTLGLCGDADQCIPAEVFRCAMQASDFLGGLQVEEVEAAGHFFHCESPARVNALLLEWLAAHQL